MSEQQTTEMANQYMNHDALWWVGQGVAFMLACMLLMYGYGGPVAAAVGYALAVLVDIRESVARSAERA